MSANDQLSNGKKRFDEKMKRVMDAVELKQPDRVPIIGGFQSFVQHWAGVSVGDSLRDYELTEKIYDDFFEEFDPDLAWDPVFMYPINAFETLGLDWMRWPGNGLPDESIYQFIEGEYMHEDEYQEFIFDPTRFVLTKWIPRSFKKLDGLKYLTGLSNSVWLGFYNSFYPFAMPEVQESLKTLMKGAEEIAAWYAFLLTYRAKMEAKGLPIAWGAFGFAPFDMLGDTMRGTEEMLIDMLLRPEEVKAACEKFVPIAIESAVNSSAVTGNKFVNMFLHKGVDEFMSVDQLNEFYWPTLKKVIDGVVEAGLVPVVYTEGTYDTRLETLRDVPKGKVIYHFEYVDMKRAKEVLGDVACIAGNVPNSLLHFGKPEEVKEYVKILLRIVLKVVDSSLILVVY